MEKFTFSIFKISCKLVFLGRDSKFLEGCQALRRDPALLVAEVPGPRSAYEAAGRPPARPPARLPAAAWSLRPGPWASAPTLSTGAA